MLSGGVFLNNEEYADLKLAPNWNIMAELVEAAKGNDRTWREFSRDCGAGVISAPTFTRIMQKKYKKPLSNRILEAIAKNAAEGSKVTLEKLKWANGDYTIGEGPNPNSLFVSGLLTDNYLKKVGGASIDRIMKAEFDRENLTYTVWRDDDVFQELEKSKIGIELREYLEPSAVYSIKGFETKYSVFYEAGVSRIDRDESRLIRNILGTHWKIFVLDAWEPQLLESTMHTIVFRFRKPYDIWCELIKNIKVNNYISIALIDSENGYVVDEQMIPRNDGKTLKSIFSLKKPKDKFRFNADIDTGVRV